MIRYVLERLLALIPVLVGISIVVFLALRVLPGDPAMAMLGERADPVRLEQVRNMLGLDEPLPVQYAHYMRDALTGNLGRSTFTNRPVTPELLRRFPATIEVTLAGLAIGWLVGIALGVIAATRRGSITDAVTMSISLVGVSMPIFWLGLILIWFFAIFVGWLPVSGRLSSDVHLLDITHFHTIDAIITGNWQALVDAIWHLILPALALTTYQVAVMARMTRSNMLEVLSEDYIRTARAKGLSEKRVILGHALRSSAIPTVTLLGLELGRQLGGAIVIETIFSWPGLGSYIVHGVLNRDYPVVQGGVLLITLVCTLVNLAVDVLYVILDPRIRLR